MKPPPQFERQPIASSPVSRDHVGSSQRRVRAVGCSKGVGEFGLEALEGLDVSPLLVAADASLEGVELIDGGTEADARP